MENRIKQLRLERGLTQLELANKLGLTPKAISFYELGQRQIPNTILAKLAEIFDCPSGYILGTEGISGNKLDAESQRLVELFRQLSDGDKEIIISIASRMSNNK